MNLGCQGSARVAIYRPPKEDHNGLEILEIVHSLHAFGGGSLNGQ